MRNSNTDLRILRTQESIKTALVALIEEKGFDALTVKDITTKARINRGTFYAHYQDKFDLMDKYEDEIMQDIGTIAKENLPIVLASLNKDTSTEQSFSFFIHFFRYLEEKNGIMNALLGPKGDLSFQTRLKDFMWKTLFEGESNALINKEQLLVPGQYLISYIRSAHIGVIQQWLNSGRVESPEKMAEILATITIQGPFYAAGLKK